MGVCVWGLAAMPYRVVLGEVSSADGPLCEDVLCGVIASINTDDGIRRAHGGRKLEGRGAGEPNNGLRGDVGSAVVEGELQRAVGRHRQTQTLHAKPVCGTQPSYVSQIRRAR